MHFHDINADLAEKIAGVVKKSGLTIETEKLVTEHFFLPVYIILNNNYNEILSFIEQTHSLTEWTQKWTELITLMAGGRFSNLTELDGYLEGKEKNLCL